MIPEKLREELGLRGDLLEAQVKGGVTILD